MGKEGRKRIVCKVWGRVVCRQAKAGASVDYHCPPPPQIGVCSLSERAAVNRRKGQCGIRGGKGTGREENEKGENAHAHQTLEKEARQAGHACFCCKQART